MIEESSYRSNVIATLMTEFANIAVRTVISILVARFLGPLGRGEYALALIVPSIFITLTALGVGEASATMIGKNKYPTPRILGSLTTYIIILLGVLAVSYFGFHSAIISLTRYAVTPSLYHLSFLFIPMMLLWGNLASVSLGMGLVKQVGYGRLLNNVLFLIIIVAAVAITPLTPFMTLAVLFLTGFIEVIYLGRFVMRRSSVLPGFDTGIMKDLLSFGSKFYLGSIFMQLNRRLDSYIVAFLLGTFDLGIYTVAIGLVEFLLAIPTIFSRASFSVSARSSNDENTPIASMAVRQIVFIMFFCALMLALFLKPLLTALYTAAFIKAYIPALLLLPGIVAFGASMVLGYILVGAGHPLETTKAAGLSCVFTVALDLVLIPRYGLSGAAVASSVAYVIGAVYLLMIYKRTFRTSFSDLLVIRRVDITSYLRDMSVLLRKDSVRSIPGKEL